MKSLKIYCVFIILSFFHIGQFLTALTSTNALSPKADCLGKVVVFEEGRLQELSNWTKRWWYKEQNSLKWPSELSQRGINTPLRLYLNLCFLTEKEKNSLSYLPLSEKQQNLLQLTDCHFISYAELITKLRELDESFIIKTAAQISLQENNTAWHIVREHAQYKLLNIPSDWGKLQWFFEFYTQNKTSASPKIFKVPFYFDLDEKSQEHAQELVSLGELVQRHESFWAMPQRSRQELIPHLHALPLKHKPSQWLSLMALKNNNLFKNYSFAYAKPKLLDAQNALHRALEGDDSAWQEVQEIFTQSYESLPSKLHLDSGITLPRPQLWQLKVQSFMESVPVDWITFGLWLLALIPLLLSNATSRVHKLLWLIAWTWQSALIISRILVLMRPPVANMYETLIYVPWVIGLVCILFIKNMRVWTVSACICALCALFSATSPIDKDFEPVIAVLNSNFWLSTHVLLVVGSYGILLLAAALGHYLLYRSVRSQKQASPDLNVKIVQWGTAMLIAGTILGGVWAAQSWGRFWDWDPKEAWAFISSAYFLIFIHLYRFRIISPFLFNWGISCGALVITFTWYGVNYILGVGLHSYGFGSANHLPYFLFCIVETLYLGGCLYLGRNLIQGKAENL